MVDPANPLEGLTRRQLQGLHNLLGDVRSSLAWSWQLPVLIRQRCWLRLEMIELGNLLRNGLDRLVRGASAEQHRHGARMPLAACVHERGRAVIRGGVDVGPLPKQVG